MHMVIKKILYFAFGIICGIAFTQQEQQYTQYMVNPYTINPALGGTEDFIDIKFGYRKQWVGLESAPRTYYLTGHTTLGKESNVSGYHHRGEHTSWHGVGGYIYSDRTGPISRSAFYGQYAFNMPLTRQVRLSVGSFFGIKQFSYDLTGLRREDFTDEVLPNNRLVQILPDVSLGAWVYSKFWYFGASAFQLLQNNISFNQFVTDPNFENGKLISHFFVTGGGKLAASEELTVVPSFAIKGAPNTPVSVDLNVKIDYNDQFFGGLSYRVGDAFAIIAGAVIEKTVEISYSYDLTTSDLRKVSNGSHEIVLGLRLKHPKHILCASSFW